MADTTKAITKISELKLTAEQHQVVNESASAAIAVGVYRELQRAQQIARASDSGCQIIGNCSCSSKELE
jgi:hypothetical protein